MNLDYCGQSIDIIIDKPLKHITSTASPDTEKSTWNQTAVRNSYV